MLAAQRPVTWTQLVEQRENARRALEARLADAPEVRPAVTALLAACGRLDEAQLAAVLAELHAMTERMVRLEVEKTAREGVQ